MTTIFNDSNERQQSLLAMHREAGEKCKALWLGVIIQAIIDATTESKKRSKIKAKEEAFLWFSDGSDDSDFAYTCELAGVDHSYMRGIISQILEKKRPCIDFRVLRKVPHELQSVFDQEHEVEEPDCKCA